MFGKLLRPVSQRTYGILHPFRKRCLLTLPHVERVDSTRQYPRETDTIGQVFGVSEVKLRASRQAFSGREPNLNTLVGYRGRDSDPAAPEAIEAIGSPPESASMFSQGWIFQLCITDLDV